ncbi:pilin [Patescibacteria group bacterium]|nr:pilin [Patescibacteria group bacterium]
MKKIYRLMPYALGLAPFIVFAAGENVRSLVEGAQSVVNAIIPLFMAVAVAVFLWGIIKYITAGGNAEKEKEARGYIIYGLIGLFVLISFWGIITFIRSALGVGGEQSGAFPSFSP